MSNEKKYELTIVELQALIGCALDETIPEDATEAKADEYCLFTSLISKRVSEHLEGSKPFPEAKIRELKSAISTINKLGIVCEAVLKAEGLL